MEFQISLVVCAVIYAGWQITQALREIARILDVAVGCWRAKSDN